MSYVVNSTAKEIGKIIGVPLAIRLAHEECERMRVIHKEISAIRKSGNTLSVKLKPGTSRKKSVNIMESIISCLINAYSKVIGAVARTIIINVMEHAAFNFGDKHPELGRMLEKTEKS